MNVINHIIRNGDETITFKTPEDSLYGIARIHMFYNKDIAPLPLYNKAFKVKPITQRLSSRRDKFRSCSFEEVFNTFRPSAVGVKLSDYTLNGKPIKLTNRAKNNGSKPLIDSSIYLIGPLSNSLYPRDNNYLKHQSFRHYKYYEKHISIKDKFDNRKRLKKSIVNIKLINSILNKKKGIGNYEFL